MGVAEAGRILEKSDATGKAVLVVSDGEDFGSGFREQADALRQKGVAVYSAGVGTPAGIGLFDVDIRNGQRRPKVDAQGRPVLTKLNESNLDALAKAGGGRYLRLDGTQHLVSLRDDLSRLQQTPLGSQNETLPVERFQIFVALAIVVLVTAWLLPSRVVFPALGPLRRLRMTARRGDAGAAGRDAGRVRRQPTPIARCGSTSRRPTRCTKTGSSTRR